MKHASAWPRLIAELDTFAAIDAFHFVQGVVVQHPAEVGALVAAEPFTLAERRALAAVTPHLSPCLYQGVNLDASRQSLRGVLAEAAFHYAEAQREGFSALPGRRASRD